MLLVKNMRQEPKKLFGHHKANLENAGVSICIKTLTKYLLSFVQGGPQA
jgi:hypothetical protein